MCGRADDNFGPAAWEVLTHLFGPLGWELESMRAEVRPTDPLRFVRRAGQGYAAPYGRWGLVPRGMSLDDAKKLSTFNARVETLDSKPVFRSAFKQQRCVIPLAGFWEWPQLPGGGKQKVRISRRDGKPLLVGRDYCEI